MRRPRRGVPEELRAAYGAFSDVAARLERAKAELLTAIPAPRRPGIPLAEALLAFREGLDDASSRMADWRVPQAEAEWARCAEGLDVARRREESLRLGAPQLAHDALLFALQDLISALEPFEDAARRFRSARR